MSAITDFFDKNKQEYIKTLKKYIGKCGTTKGWSLFIGVVLSLSALAIVVLTIISYPVHCCDSIWGFCLATGLLGIAAILCFATYKSVNSQIDYYVRELIVLRDLEIAINICENTDPNDKEDTQRVATIPGSKTTITKHLTQKSQMQEQIIETLLQRCSN